VVKNLTFILLILLYARLFPIMTALLIETSSAEAVVALLKNGLLLKEWRLKGDSSLSRNLFLSIQALLKCCNLDLKQLHYIALGIGPGSYTGTRVGATVAKTLSFSLNIPLIPFCSPLAFLPFEEGSFASTLQTKKGDIFLLKGEIKKGALLSGYTHKYIQPSELSQELNGTEHQISECPTLHLPTLTPYIHAKYSNNNYNSLETAELLYFSELK
jgi:tRNA threonylcarbamoyladenosine biosynthesis protein TsaB